MTITGPQAPTASALPSDLGPSLCPTCGTLLVDGLDPIRMIASVVLVLVASFFGLLVILFVLLGLAAAGRGDLSLLLLSVPAGGASALFGHLSRLAGARPPLRRGPCPLCKQTEGHWACEESPGARLAVAMFAGPTVVIGVGAILVGLGLGHSSSLVPMLSLCCFGSGLLLVTAAFGRTTWSARLTSGTASAITMGRVFLRGAGRAVSPFTRPLLLGESHASRFLSADEEAALVCVATLAARGSLCLETREEIVWSRSLWYRRLTIVPAAVLVRWDRAAPEPASPSELEQAIGRVLRQHSRAPGAVEEADYRAGGGDQNAEDPSPVFVELVVLLREAGIDPIAARAVESSLRSSAPPLPVTAAELASLRTATVTATRPLLLPRSGSSMAGPAGPASK